MNIELFKDGLIIDLKDFTIVSNLIEKENLSLKCNKSDIGISVNGQPNDLYKLLVLLLIDNDIKLT